MNRLCPTDALLCAPYRLQTYSRSWRRPWKEPLDLTHTVLFSDKEWNNRRVSKLIHRFLHHHAQKPVLQAHEWEQLCPLLDYLKTADDSASAASCFIVALLLRTSWNVIGKLLTLLPSAVNRDVLLTALLYSSPAVVRNLFQWVGCCDVATTALNDLLILASVSGKLDLVELILQVCGGNKLDFLRVLSCFFGRRLKLENWAKTVAIVEDLDIFYQLEPSIFRARKLLQLFTGAGFDMNEQDSRGRTVVFYLLTGFVAGRDLLQEFPFDLTVQRKSYGDTVLTHLIRKSRPERVLTVLPLLTADLINVQLPDGWSALLLALKKNYFSVAIPLLKQGFNVHLHHPDVVLKRLLHVDYMRNIKHMSKLLYLLHKNGFNLRHLYGKLARPLVTQCVVKGKYSVAAMLMRGWPQLARDAYEVPDKNGVTGWTYLLHRVSRDGRYIGFREVFGEFINTGINIDINQVLQYAENSDTFCGLLSVYLDKRDRELPSGSDVGSWASSLGSKFGQVYELIQRNWQRREVRRRMTTFVLPAVRQRAVEVKLQDSRLCATIIALRHGLLAADVSLEAQDLLQKKMGRPFLTVTELKHWLEE